MTEDEAFLRAILEDPADDGVRLIYADWLEEHGQCERAEFLRLQCAHRDPVRQWALARKYQDSWFRSVLGMRWADPVHQWRVLGEPVDLGFFGEGQHSEVELQVRRGFVQAVSLSLDDFRRYAAHLFRSQPVTRVALTDRVPQSGGITRSWLTCPGDPHLATFSYDLPSCLELFLGEPNSSFPAYWKRWDYPTLEAAQEALSRACVAWGRHAAGLPPLPSAAYNPGSGDNVAK